MSVITLTCPQILGQSGLSPGLAPLTTGVPQLSVLTSPGPRPGGDPPPP